MTHREVFWKLVEVALAQSSLPPHQAARAYAHVWRNEIDLFIDGFNPATTRIELANKAGDYVTYCQGGPEPAWLVNFNRQFSE